MARYRRYHPTSANAIPADRRAASDEGRIGGPCHAITTAGTFCKRRAVMVGSDGYGYCNTHAPRDA